MANIGVLEILRSAFTPVWVPCAAIDILDQQSTADIPIVSNNNFDHQSFFRPQQSCSQSSIVYLNHQSMISTVAIVILNHQSVISTIAIVTQSLIDDLNSSDRHCQSPIDNLNHSDRHSQSPIDNPNHSDRFLNHQS